MAYVNYAHRVDIYEKSSTTTAAGQRKATWAIADAQIKCAYIPKVSDLRNRMVGTTYNTDQIIAFFFPPTSNIDFDNRLYNVKDQYGNILEAGPIEITSIVKAPFIDGKIHHIEVAGFKVMED